jgi:TadE-like protein
MGGMTGLLRRLRAPRARRREDGTALVEAAIVTPLLLLLVFGMIEFGYLFKDSLTAANASRAGARVGSSAVNDPLADFNILKAVQAAGNLAHIQKVVVFKADGPDGAVPGACQNGAVAGECNYYTAADLAIDQATFSSPGYSADDAWPSSSRVCSLSAPGGPDYLGVWIEAHHSSFVIKMFPDKDIHDTTVMRLEPC